MNKDIDEDKKKNKKIILLFLGFIVFIIIYFLVNDIPIFDDVIKEINISKENEIPESTEKSIVDEFSEYSNYYKKTKIVSDKGIIEVELETDGSKIIGYKRKYNEETTFVYDNNYYVLNDDKFVKDETFCLFDEFDETFNNIENIIELINEQEYSTSTEDGNFVRNYVIGVSEVVRIYNSINDTSYAVKESNNVKIDLYYKDKINKIVIDLTELYSIIDNCKYLLVEYEIEFDNIGKIDLSDYEELVNLNN